MPFTDPPDQSERWGQKNSPRTIILRPVGDTKIGAALFVPSCLCGELLSEKVFARRQAQNRPAYSWPTSWTLWWIGDGPKDNFLTWEIHALRVHQRNFSLCALCALCG